MASADPLIDSKRKKYTLQEILAQYGNLSSVQFTPFEPERAQNAFTTLPPLFPPTPTPFDYFTLFFTLDIIKLITKHTNEYAAIPRFYKTDTQARPWESLYWCEVWVFIGAIIYMGIHKEPQIPNYWNKDFNIGPIHTISQHMSQIRFEQIKRYFHISSPSKDKENGYDLPSNKIWWYKLEPLASHLQATFQRYYSPSSEVSIDELMVRFFGRSLHTYKMPNKPITQGYKIYGIADHGYIYSFIWSSKEKGLQELIRFPHLTNTGCLVRALATSLPRRYMTIYMDNYFTSIPLFEELRKLHFGAVGTTRPHAEFPKGLSVLKTENLGAKLDWNTLLAAVVNNTLCLAWQDNNIVLAISNIYTVHNANDFKVRERKRPAKSSTNGRIVRKVFGDEPTKILEIPTFIDDYNHNMGGVDIANQLRESYETHRPTFRNWWPLFYWFIDVTVINSYRLYSLYITELQQKPCSHYNFRVQLYQRLLAFSLQVGYHELQKELGGKRVFGVESPYIHTWERRSGTTSCAWCAHIIRYKRLIGQIPKGVKERARRSNQGCAFCNVALCKDTNCWEQYHKPA